MPTKHIPAELSERLRLDAAETLALEDAYDQTLAIAYSQDYDLLRARQFLRPNPSPMDPYKKTFKFRYYNGVGQVNMISSRVHDFPSVELYAQEGEFTAARFGNSYGWDEEELGEAAAAGVPSLQAQKATLARDVMEEAIEYVICFGANGGRAAGQGPITATSVHPGVTGLLNNANVATSAVATSGGLTTWEAKMASNPQLVVEDIRAWFRSITTATNNRAIGRPNKLLIPQSSYDLLSQYFGSSNADRTVLDVIRQQLPGLDIQGWDMLEDASPAGGKLGVMYNDSARNLFYAIPQPFKQGTLYRQGPEFWSVPCSAKCAGTVIIFPLTLAYRTAF